MLHSFVVRILLLLALLPLLVSAQSTTATATLQGTILDSTGAAVPGANVAATNLNTRAQRTATTKAAGHYTPRGIASGTWSLSVEAPGFAPSSVASLTLS